MFGSRQSPSLFTVAQAVHTARRWHKVHTVWRTTHRQPSHKDETSQSSGDPKTASGDDDKLHHYQSILSENNAEFLAEQGLYDEQLVKDPPPTPAARKRQFNLKIPLFIKNSDSSAKRPCPDPIDAASSVAKRLLEKRKNLQRGYSVDQTPLLKSEATMGNAADKEKVEKTKGTVFMFMSSLNSICQDIPK